MINFAYNFLFNLLKFYTVIIKKNLHLLSILVPYIALVSCSKSQESAFVNQADNDEPRYGILSFNSKSEFNEAIKKAEEGNLYTPSTRSGSAGFLSLYDALVEEKMASLSDEDKAEIAREGLVYEPEDDIICSPVFMSFLNQKREIEVEGKIYRYVSNGVIIYSDSCQSDFIDSLDTDQYDSLMDGEEITMTEGIVFHRIEYAETVISAPTKVSSLSPVDGFYLENGTFIPSKNIHNTLYEEKGGDTGKFRKWVTSLTGMSVLSINDFDSKHRMTLRVFSQDFVVYEGTGMAIRFQQKVAGMWFRKKCEEMRYGCVGPLVKYTYASPLQLLDEAIIKPAPKSLYTKPVVFFKVSLPILKDLSVSNQDIQRLLFNALSSNQTTISRFLNNNPNLDKNPRGVFSSENPNIAYYLFPRVNEQVVYDDRRECIEWDNNWVFGATLTFNLSTGGISGSPFLPDVRSIEILRVFTYGAVKYNNEWRMCVVFC